MNFQLSRLQKILLGIVAVTSLGYLTLAVACRFGGGGQKMVNEPIVYTATGATTTSGIPVDDDTKTDADIGTSTAESTVDEETSQALKTAQQSGAQIIKENDQSYEIIDKPLPKWEFPQKYFGKLIEFTVKSKESAGQTYTVILDPQTGDYRETMSISGGFYLVSSNGIICYGRPTYKNAYCVREKYSPLAIVRYFLGQKNLEVRKLSEDEEELSRLMNDYGWVPDNILAAMMAAAETSFSQLAQDKLAKGTVLSWESQDGREKNDFGTVESIDFNKPMENLKTRGIHLTYLMADIYNAKDNPYIWNKEADSFGGFPSPDMENGTTGDESFEEFFRASGFSKEHYIISQ